MRKIDDKEIINKFKSSDTYKIKSTSNEILYKYELEKQKEKVLEEEKLKKTRRLRIGFMGLGGAALVGGVALVTLFFVNPQNEVHLHNLENIFNPSKNETLKNQMATFSSFQSISDNTLRINKINRLLSSSKDESFDEKTYFYKASEVYDSLQDGIKYMNSLDEVKAVEKDEEFTFNDIKYSTQTLFYLGNSEKPFAKFYYSEVDLDEDEKEINGLYFTNNKYYEAKLEEESEIESEEKEEEVSLILREINSDSKLVYVVENEIEKEIDESESCYSYAIYDEKYFIQDKLKRENANYFLEYKSKEEGNDKKSAVRLKDGLEEAEFNHIKYINEDDSTFICENINGYEDLEDVISVNILEDGSRLYTYKGITKTIK